VSTEQNKDTEKPASKGSKNSSLKHSELTAADGRGLKQKRIMSGGVEQSKKKTVSTSEDMSVLESSSKLPPKLPISGTNTATAVSYPPSTASPMKHSVTTVQPRKRGRPRKITAVEHRRRELDTDTDSELPPILSSRAKSTIAGKADSIGTSVAVDSEFGDMTAASPLKECESRLPPVLSPIGSPCLSSVHDSVNMDNSCTDTLPIPTPHKRSKDVSNNNKTSKKPMPVLCLSHHFLLLSKMIFLLTFLFCILTLFSFIGLQWPRSDSYFGQYSCLVTPSVPMALSSTLSCHCQHM